MNIRPDPFERQFEPRDAKVFEALTDGLSGARCVRAVETYGEGIRIELGALVPRSRRLSERLPAERGEWVLDNWASHVAMSTKDGRRLDSEMGQFESIRDHLASLVGSELDVLTIGPNDLTLTLGFSNGITVELRPDSTSDADQWFIQLRAGGTVGAVGKRAWFYRRE